MKSQVVISEASVRGGKQSKETDDDAAEAKPWRGGGVVLLRQRGEG